MYWDEAKAAIRSHIETNWRQTAHAGIPLLFQNEQVQADTYVAILIEGTFADKGLFGSVGKRLSVEHGTVFIHAYTPIGIGDALADSLVVTMTTVLELQTIASAIKLEGGDPPSPVDQETGLLVPNQQPEGNYYRCSGAVPFIVTGSR